MSEKRLPILFIVLFMTATIALSGCGGGRGGSRTSPTTSMPGGGTTMPPVDNGETREVLPLPSGHGLAAGEIPVAPGGSEERGNVVVSCPSGGMACVVTVAADGTAVYDRTGGTPTVMSAQEPWTLPSVHGLAAGEITVQPGRSEEHDNIVVTCPAGGMACVVTVATDGAATYERTGGVPTFMLVPPEEFPELPLQQPVRSAQASIVDLEGVLHVGANVAPPADQLAAGGAYNGVTVSSGRVLDGVGADRVIEYLEQYVNLGEYKNTVGLETFSTRPVVRLADGTSDEFAEYATRAVQLINAALPYEKRIVFSRDSAPPLAAIADVPDGDIFIDFAPYEDWNVPNKPPPGVAVGIDQSELVFHYNTEAKRWEVQETRASHVWIDSEEILTALVLNPDTRVWEEQVLESRVDDTDTIVKFYSDDAVIRTLAHEIIHALSFQHPDPARFPESIMNIELFRERFVYPAGTGFRINEQVHVPGHILFPLDREALLAAYSRLEPGTLPEDLSAESLGTWDDTSFHIRGDLDFPGGQASFGVASRNGLVQPWAFGPTPWTNLADNPVLSETVTWNGALLGITPSAETVAGSARLAVELATLDGQLDFTTMEHWGTNEAPGAIGTGATWGDGDLGYAIEVRGNTFIQTGGDDGEVTGAFFGAAHEAMGGVVERTDLAAGFGGKR